MYRNKMKNGGKFSVIEKFKNCDDLKHLLSSAFKHIQKIIMHVNIYNGPNGYITDLKRRGGMGDV